MKAYTYNVFFVEGLGGPAFSSIEADSIEEAMDVFRDKFPGVTPQFTVGYVNYSIRPFADRGEHDRCHRRCEGCDDGGDCDGRDPDAELADDLGAEVRPSGKHDEPVRDEDALLFAYGKEEHPVFFRRDRSTLDFIEFLASEQKVRALKLMKHAYLVKRC